MLEKKFAEAQEAIDKGGKVLLDFWAPWCGPCRTMTPVLEKFASENSDITVIKVNVDETPETANFNVRSIPTIIAFLEGDEVNRTVGIVSPDKLRNMFS